MAAHDEQHLYSLPYDYVRPAADYNELQHKPMINGIVLEGDKSLNDLDINIPSKLSELQNDEGFITSENVPTKVSELENDSNYVSANVLGTAAYKNTPPSGDADTTQVVMGNDSRLTNARNAADVHPWAKAANKPSYTASEITYGANSNVDSQIQTLTNKVDSQRQVLTAVSDSIAPTQTTLVADITYYKGMEFYYNGSLYRATTTINLGESIVINGNCETADTITTQFAKFNLQDVIYDTDSAIGELSITGIEKYRLILVEGYEGQNTGGNRFNLICSPLGCLNKLVNYPIRASSSDEYMSVIVVQNKITFSSTTSNLHINKITVLLA